MPSVEKGYEVHEGLVLRSLDYKDGQKIITLFTPTKGLISLIVKGINRKKTHLLTLTSPLTQAEYHFSIHRSDLYSFRDGSPINTHHNLRSDLSHLQTAVGFAEALLGSQFPGKPAPALYQLTLAYLKHLPSFADPTPLKASFILKLLKHDGHLSLTPACAHCDNPPRAYSEGEVFCHTHSPSYAIPFSAAEWETLVILAEARSIPQLQELKVDPDLMQKIERFFNSTLYNF